MSKYSSILTFILLAIAVAFISCSDDDSGTSPNNEQNRPPVISSMTAVPDTFEAEHSSVITVVANDADGDALQYLWDGHGSFLPAPTGQPGQAVVTNCCPVSEVEGGFIICTVRDGNSGEDTDSVQVWVKPGSR